MKNTFGNSVTMTLFGESHGAEIGVVLDGLAPGLAVDEEQIATLLAQRSPSGEVTTQRHESDRFRIISGVFNGKTTGTPLCIIIPNSDTDSSAYNYGRARPSQADYAAFRKYHGYEDYRGGGHFSGRITAAVVAAGAILIGALEKLNIEIGTHILQCAEVRDSAFNPVAPKAEIARLRNAPFPVLNPEKHGEMLDAVLIAKLAGDSVGGITQTAVFGLPAGLGEPWFDSIESMLSHAMFGIGGIKGIDFGAGFDTATMQGTQYNDQIRLSGGKICTESNNDGGINGGITNGMPLIFRCAVKPTASIAAEQRSVDFIKNEEIGISVQGRHDPAFILRICPVINSLTALTICDMLALQYGTDVLLRGIPD